MKKQFVQAWLIAPLTILLASAASALPPVTDGLITALDGTDVTTNGSLVTSWNDQSGHNNHATQSTADSQPMLVTAATVNGTNALSFDGLDDFLDIMPNPTDFDKNQFSWYVVHQPTAADNSRLLNSSYADIDPIIGGDQFGGQTWATLAGTNARHRAMARDVTNSFNAANTPNGSLLIDQFNITGATWDGTNETTDNLTAILVTGTDSQIEASTTAYGLDGNAVPTGHMRTRLGAGASFNDSSAIETPSLPFTGLIAEVLIYDRVLTPSEQQSVGSYLFSKHFGTGPDVFEWDTADSGNWLTASNWSDAAFAPPNNNNVGVAFGDAIGDMTRTVFMDEALTVNNVTFENTLGGSYIIAGSPGVTFAAKDDSTLPSISVTQGSHQFQSAVNLDADTSVSVTSGTLDFNNEIALNGNTLTISGNVNINHSIVGGGSVSSSSGVLGTAGSTAISGNLVASDTLQFDLGEANTDSFDVSGTATLSGVLDVVLEPGYSPSGSYTLISAASGLNTSGLALDPNDAATFALGAQGNDLILSVRGGNGDFNGDGFVDGVDFLLWQRGGSPNPLSQSDLEEWQNNYGTTPVSSVTSAVPEPSNMSMLLVIGSICAFAGQRRSFAMA